MKTNTATKPSWTITNGAIEPNKTLSALLAQQRILSEQLAPLRTGLVGVILAREFAANPELSQFKIEIDLWHGTTFRVTFEKSLNLLGQEISNDFQLKMADDDELEVLYSAFEKNEFGVVEIECSRDDIASLLAYGELNGNEAFEKYFPDLFIPDAKPH